MTFRVRHGIHDAEGRVFVCEDGSGRLILENLESGIWIWIWNMEYGERIRRGGGGLHGSSLFRLVITFFAFVVEDSTLFFHLCFIHIQENSDTR